MTPYTDLPNWFYPCIRREEGSRRLDDAIHLLIDMCECSGVIPIGLDQLLSERYDATALEKFLYDYQEELEIEAEEFLQDIETHKANGSLFIGENFVGFRDESIERLSIVQWSEKGSINAFWYSDECRVISIDPVFIFHGLFGNVATISKDGKLVCLVDGDSGWSEEGGDDWV